MILHTYLHVYHECTIILVTNEQKIGKHNENNKYIKWLNDHIQAESKALQPSTRNNLAWTHANMIYF